LVEDRDDELVHRVMRTKKICSSVLLRRWKKSGFIWLPFHTTTTTVAWERSNQIKSAQIS
jgi:hypothetical protein